MPKPSLLSLLCSLSLVSLPLAAAELQPRQLAGPPEKFAQMRAPDPAESAILSKSALLPVELTPAGKLADVGGEEWVRSVYGVGYRFEYLPTEAESLPRSW
ncbi:helix-turn-helix domain-containing protein [Xanthomonas hortorum pv. hederae]|nr:helix-turn-helix domain-containing protein [Xanthomonas hortorum pv. hederae]